MELANFISLVILIGLVLTSAFFQLSIILWTSLIGAGLVALSFSGSLTGFPFVMAWFCYLVAAAFANLHKLRQRYLVQPALKNLQKRMPTISNTEREAIEAGNTWWEKELFSGSPHWKKLFSIPRPSLTQEEQSFLDNQVEQLCAMLNDWQITYENRDLPEDVWGYLKKEKFFGMVIPKQYGGLGFSALAHSTVVMKIATRSLSAAVNTMVPNSLGPAELLLHYGTDEQKNYYLPRLASGMEIPCFALTAPGAGSDAGSIPDTGIVCRGEYDGKETVGIRLNWDKRYITLAPVATVLGLAFQLYDPDRLLGGEENMGITLCLIPTSHPGVEIGSRHFPLQLAFMNGPTRGRDVFIPLDWIIGGPKMAGQGWRMLMECLSIGRSISLPALATACGKISYRYTGAYARLRRQFNTPIASFEGIEEALGNIAGYTYILEASRMMTAGAVDLKVKPSIASAIAKYHMTEISRTVIAHAMDVHAGHMIQVGPRNFLANLHFAIPISITVEGANILTRNLIIFGQGAIRCHPYLLKEVELITAKDTKIEALDRVLMSHIGFFVSNLLRNLAYGLTGGKFIFATIKQKRIKRYQRQLTRMSAALALMSDTSLMLLGGSLKRRERISARLGDILSQLYLASTVLKYFHDNNKPETDVDYVCWSLQQCLQKIQVACDDWFENFPHPFVGKLLNWIIFPFGSAYKNPKDELHKNIVLSMLSPSEIRDRLTQYCYVSKQEDELSYRLEKALAKVSTIDPLWKKLQKAVQSGVILNRYNFAERVRAAEQAGVLSADEAHTLNEFESLRNEIIKVNEFSFDLSKVIA
ncbi:acyl-CoA dehydrogenase [Aquicella lusitana]|uniref:Acyl-coenzyme A dehydrogenase n=1 Tax=Aquicella lusitana TaxID=254246 RepID=A0A370GRV2_9COXI|nr:acyl-CoA dehydrogenase [Aquicella lusitana]RDI46050.1 acyl-CoA dehydrogenase [Aquicella lusitana]VVC73353.1 Acyl-coenzyme A dehydrogenase [Aquicella lusitana]